MRTSRTGRPALVCALLLLAWAESAQAQGANASVALSVGPTAVTLSATLLATAPTLCRGTLETTAIRIAYDGTTPTATSGQPVAVGDQVVLQNAADIRNFRAIAQASTTNSPGILNLTCSSGTPAAASYVQAAPYFTFSALQGAVSPAGVALTGGVDYSGLVRALRTSSIGVLSVQNTPAPGLPLPTCNPVRTTNCTPKGF